MGLRVRKDRGFTVLDRNGFGSTLAGGLIPCVDKLRDLNTKFGVRPYIVRQVFTRWSGGLRGRGVEEVVLESAVLPTPKVASLDALDSTLISIGNTEYGSLEVSQISGRYTEDYILGRNAFGDQTPADAQFYYEIEFPDENGRFPGIKRRFTVSGTPSYNPGGFQWTVQLTRAAQDRSRNGTPEG